MLGEERERKRKRQMTEGKKNGGGQEDGRE